MSGDRHEALGRLAQAAMNGLLDACRAGDGASYVDPELARQALVACLALVLEADPEVKTRRDMREVSDAAARELRLQVEALRRHLEATGKHRAEMQARYRCSSRQTVCAIGLAGMALVGGTPI